MTDAGAFGEPLDPRFTGREVSEFSELVLFVWATAQLVGRTLQDLNEVDDLDEEVRAAIPGIHARVPVRTVQLIGQILGGEHADALRRHGLADGDPEWRFKFAEFLTSAAEADRVRRESDDDPAARPGAIRRILSKVKHPLRAANVILRSLSSAVPGGGAFTEIKDGVEAVIDRVTAEG